MMIQPELLDRLGIENKAAKAVNCNIPEKAKTIVEIQQQIEEIDSRVDTITEREEALLLVQSLINHDVVDKAKANLDDVIKIAQKVLDDSGGVANDELRSALLNILNDARETINDVDNLAAINEKIAAINDAKKKVEDNMAARVASEAARKRTEQLQKTPAGQRIADTARGFLTDKTNAYLYSKTWGYGGSPNMAYIKAFRKLESGLPDDCGNFVSTTVLSSGVDPKFTKGRTDKIKSYLASSPKWNEVPNTGNAANLQPGDVFIVDRGDDGHTFLYLGGGQAAQARYGWAIGYAFDINKVRPLAADNSWEYSMEGVMAMDGQLIDGIWQGYGQPYQIYRVHY
jgi:hypothetical protein